MKEFKSLIKRPFLSRNFLFFLLLGTTFSAFAQTSDSDLAIETVKTLFDGMRAGDSTMVRSVFASNAQMQTTYTNKKGEPQIKTGSVDGFAEAVGTPHDQVWDEKIWSYDVKIEGALASIWTEYTFYIGDQLSHCGVNAFHLHKGSNGWKILQITDTRRRTNCREDPERAIHTLLDNWHHAAAVADETIYFGSMGKESIYIGTDATERWPIKVYEAWAKKYFERESAWDFKRIERAIYFAQSKEVAWFNETLDTWMGVCRGSGVLEKVDGVWKIQHYHLAITVPNEKVKEFLELIEE